MGDPNSIDNREAYLAGVTLNVNAVIFQLFRHHGVSSREAVTNVLAPIVAGLLKATALGSSPEAADELAKRFESEVRRILVEMSAKPSQPAVGGGA